MNIHTSRFTRSSLRLGFLIAVLGVIPVIDAMAQCSYNTATDYQAFAIANSFASIDINLVVTYQSGYGPGEDKDEDGLTNREEFEGWATTVNGVPVHFGWNSGSANRQDGSCLEAVDSDGDGLSDYYESGKALASRTNPLAYDTDGDGMGDAWEVHVGLNPLEDGSQPGQEDNDPAADPDGDGLTNEEEMLGPDGSFPSLPPATVETPNTVPAFGGSAGYTLPLNYDSDGDELIDSFEYQSSSINPFEANDADADPDLDGLTSYREQCIHPLLANEWGVTPRLTPGLPPSIIINSLGYGSYGRQMLFASGYLNLANYNTVGDNANAPGNVLWGHPVDRAYAGASYGGTVRWTNPSDFDSDDDLLPDGWELEHGLNTLSGDLFQGAVFNLSGSLGDPDSDGLFNYEEYFGADGYRIDLITGTGDETVPWIIRAFNNTHRSTFGSRIGQIGMGAEADRAPQGYALDFITTYAPDLLPGFFDPVAFDAGDYVPVPGVPPDMPLNFEPTFNPFATAISGILFDDVDASGQYTAGDNLWYDADGDGAFTAGEPVLAGAPVAGDIGGGTISNSPVLYPVYGRDTDNDGLSDFEEVYAAYFASTETSPVQAQGPFVPRSAKITSNAGLPTPSLNPRVEGRRFFSRSFTIETWVYLADNAPNDYRGSFIRGDVFLNTAGTVTRMGYSLGVSAKGAMNAVPFLAFQPLNGLVTNQIFANASIPLDQWVHLAGIYDQKQNRMALYVNGTLATNAFVVQESAATFGITYGGQLTLAKDNGGTQSFADNLWIDEVRVWGIPNALAKIQDNFGTLIDMAQLVKADEYLEWEDDIINGLFAYYTFDDGGDSADDVVRRSKSSLLGYAYPHDVSVLTYPDQEYLFGDGGFALASDAILGAGNAFEFDTVQVAPVDGQLDGGAFDSDRDGLPDDWEIVHELNPFRAATPDHVQFSQYDPAWASTNTPSWSASGEVSNDGDRDIDGDGISNQGEYTLGTNPRDGEVDILLDLDGDGLSNIEEFSLGTDPLNPDTDDDGFSDSDELNPNVFFGGQAITSPYDARSPLFQRSAVLTGAPIDVPGPGLTDRFTGNNGWAVECWVKLDDANQSGSLIRRVIDSNGQTNFDLRVDANVPAIKFSSAGGTVVTAGVGNIVLPAQTWVHLAASWEKSDKSLSLMINGKKYAEQVSMLEPASGRGRTVLGDGVEGLIDEVRFWNKPRNTGAVEFYLNRHVFATAQPEDLPPLDITFLIDVSGSMGPFITQVKSNITKFVTDLSSRGFNVQLAGVRYSDTLTGGGSFDTPPSGAGFFSSAEAFLGGWLDPLGLQGGGDLPEDGLAALQFALDGDNFNPTFQSDAQKVFILLTDASVKDLEDGDTGAVLSRQAVIDDLIEAGVFVEGIFGGAGDVGDIVDQTGGSRYDIRENDYSLLFNDIIRSILEKTRGISAYYPFDDGENTTITNDINGLITGYGAEDYANRLNWNFALDPIIFTNDAPEVHGFTDVDLNGLPDSWEDMFMPDLTTTATNDVDGDGLLNIHEYELGWNPLAPNTDNDDVVDFDEDSDGDGVSDGVELYTLGTDPLKVDTDDDGIQDGDEVTGSTSPTDSASPLVGRAANFGGSGRLFVRDDSDADTTRNWTVEAWVRPASGMESGIILRRAERIGVSGQRVVDYELGISNNVPYIMYSYRQAGSLITESVAAPRAITAQWTHLAGVFDDADHQLRLYINGKRINFARPVARPVISGFGYQTTIGGGGLYGDPVERGFDGSIDAVRVWNYARSGLEIQNDRSVRLPEFTAGVPDATRAPIRLFNFDDGGSTAENSRYVSDWEDAWMHAAEFQGDAAWTVAPFPPAALDTDDDTITDVDENSEGWAMNRSDISFTYRALDFDGTGDVYVDELVDNEETGVFALTNWTLEAWVRPNQIPGARAPLIQRRDKATGLVSFELGIVNTAGVVHPYTRFQRNDAGNDFVTIQHATQIEVGTSSNHWSHIAATFSNGVYSLFVDGAMIKYDNVIGAGPYVGGPGYVTLGSTGFVGQLQEVRIWNQPRTQYEIMENYRNSLLFSAALLESSYSSISAYIGRNTESEEDGLVYDFTSVGSYEGIAYVAGRRTHKFTVEAWVKVNPGSSGGIVAERKVDLLLVPNAPDWRINHSLRISTFGNPQGVWQGEVTSYSVVRETVTNDVTVVDRLETSQEVVSRNITSEVDIRDGEWHHLALVGDGERIALYIDGELDTQVNSYYTFRALDGEKFEGFYRSYSPIGSVLRIADDEGSVDRFDGTVDEVAFWNDNLTMDEIQKHRDFGLDKADIKAGLAPISPLPEGARDPGGDRRRLVSYVTFDGELSLPFIPDRANENIAYRVLPQVSGSDIVNPSTPPITTDRVRTFDKQLRGYFAAVDGGEHAENYMFRNDFGYAGQLRGSGTEFITLDSLSIAHLQADSDGDGLPDWWETLHGLDAGSNEGLDGAWGDVDGDGLSNVAEFRAGTDPTNFDSDGDGLSDFDSRTNASAQTWGEIYTDGDAMDDAWEVNFPGTVSPLVYDAHLDPDGDRWSNYSEFMAGTDPSDSLKYPIPQLAARFDYVGPNANGPIWINIYSTPRMDGVPDAVASAGAVESAAAVVGLVDDSEVVASGKIPQIPVVPGSVTLSIGCNISSIRFVDQGNGVLRSIETQPNLFGQIDYTTGEWSASLTPFRIASETLVCGEWDKFVGLPQYPFDGVITILEGYVREGPAYIFAYIDSEPNDGEASTGTNNIPNWQPSEPAGLLQQQPVNISWGDVPQMRFGLTDDQYGYVRFAWTPDATTEPATVNITRLSTGLPVMLTNYIIRNRNYFHEGDLQAAGIFSLTSSTEVAGYEWRVGTQRGTNTIDFTANLTTPVPMTPAGLVVYADTPFVFQQHTNSSNFRLQIRAGSTNGLIVYDATLPSTYRDLNGVCRFSPPFYMGDGAFTNGAFFWRVMSMNGRKSSLWSSYQQFAVNLEEAPAGAYSISGDLYYFGCAVRSNVIVQAFESDGFSGRAAAQVRRSGTGTTFKILGLPAGTFHVRAFMDQNRNEIMEPWESWSFVKDYVFLSDYEVKPIPVPGNKFDQKLILRDRDINNNDIADACEYQAIGTLGVNQSTWDDDGDGLPDWMEIFTYGTDPYNEDTSGDGLSDGEKVALGLNPLINDFDGDGYSDVLEILLGSNPKNAGSIPPVSSHLKITGYVPEAGGLRVVYNREPVVTNIAFDIVASVAGATNVFGPYTKLPFSDNIITTNGWMSGPWSYLVLPGADPYAFFQIQWKAK